MTTMGKYCKAYQVGQLRAFSHWTEAAENTRKVTTKVDGTEIESHRSLTDDDILYLQENYVITDGIFKDEHIIFDHVTPEWKEFCDQILGFEIPVYEPVAINP